MKALCLDVGCWGCAVDWRCGWDKVNPSVEGWVTLVEEPVDVVGSDGLMFFLENHYVEHVLEFKYYIVPYNYRLIFFPATYCIWKSRRILPAILGCVVLKSLGWFSRVKIRVGGVTSGSIASLDLIVFTQCWGLEVIID
jgi:hypothetical protein